MVSSATVSLVAVRVTVWGVPQLVSVNVRYSGLTVNCVGAELVTERVTLVEVWVSRTTVKVSVVPASVGAAVVLETVMPADWATAAMGQVMSSVESTARRMAARLEGACHDTLGFAILDYLPFRRQGLSWAYGD